MTAVAEAVEKMKYHDDHDDYRSHTPTFNMESWYYKTECGTAGCLATWAVIGHHKENANFSRHPRALTLNDGTITTVQDEATRIFDLSQEVAAELFSPDLCDQAKPDRLYEVTPQEAAQALRNTIRTGTPQWGTIICSTDSCQHYCEDCEQNLRQDNLQDQETPQTMQLHNNTAQRDLTLCTDCHAARACPNCNTDSNDCTCNLP